MNCHGGDKLDRRLRNKDFYRHQGQERNTLSCPECRRSSRQRQERRSTDTSVSQDYVDLQLGAQTTEANRKETTARPTAWLPRTRWSRQVKDLLPRSIASEMARETLGSKASNKITGKAEPCRGCRRRAQDQTREGEGRKDRSLLPQTTSRRNKNQRGKWRERSKQKARTQSRLRCPEAGWEGRTTRGARRAAASSARTPPCSRRRRSSACRRALPSSPSMGFRSRAGQHG